MALEPKKISELTDEQKAALLEALGVQTVLPVLTEYPTTDDTKAGTKFLYKGNEWHYMTQAEIDSCEWTDLVEVGFPAPVNKVFNLNILYPDTDIYLGHDALSAEREDTSLLDFLGLGMPNKAAGFSIASGNPKTISSIKNAGLLKALKDQGTNVRFRLTNCGMTAEVINSLFTQLPETSNTVTINVSTNPGSATCDTTIATDKGYTVVTS